jgi:hypothetical protein
LGADPLAPGVLGREALELGDDVRVPAEDDVSVDSIFERCDPQLLETGDVRLEGALEAEVRQRWTTPEGEGVAQAERGLIGTPGIRGGSRLSHRLLEPMQVELSVLQPQLIARWAGTENPTLAASATRLEQVAELGDMHLKRLSGRLGWARAPKRVDQLIARDNLVCVQKQDPEE